MLQFHKSRVNHSFQKRTNRNQNPGYYSAVPEVRQCQVTQAEANGEAGPVLRQNQSIRVFSFHVSSMFTHESPLLVRVRAAHSSVCPPRRRCVPSGASHFCPSEVSVPPP